MIDIWQTFHETSTLGNKSCGLITHMHHGFSSILLVSIFEAPCILRLFDKNPTRLAAVALNLILKQNSDYSLTKQ